MNRRIHSIPVLTLALATVASCAGLLDRNKPTPPTFDEPSYQGLAEDRAATTAAGVKVLTTFNLDDELPEGVTLVNRDHLQVTEGFPSTDDPHQILGVLRMKYTGNSSRNRSQKEALERVARVQQMAHDRLAAAAAAHGANAVFIQRSGRNFAAQALYLSAARTSYPSASSLLASSERPAGFRKLSSATRALDAFEPITIRGAARTCYSLVFALDGDARLGRHTRKGLTVAVQSKDVLLAKLSYATPIFGKGRSHVQSIGCARDAGPLTLSLHSRARRGKPRDLGEGKVVVQVLSKRIGKSEISSIVEARKEGWKRTRREGCESCYYLRVRCDSGDPRRCPRYLTCLRKRGETPNTCRELRR